LPRWSGSPETTSGRNSGETQAKLEGKGGTALLDVEAKLWRVLAEVEVKRGGWSTVEQGRGVVELVGCGGARALGCGGEESWVRRGEAGRLKEAARISA
jgi:hypothetical protein